MAVNQINEYFKVVVAKRAIEDKYIDGEDKVLATFAEQGHVIPPGVVSEYITDVDVERRIRFEEADAKIVQEQVNIELDQLDLIYKQQIATAQITLDQQETALMIAFDEEVAAILSGYNLAEEDLAIKALAIEERGLIIQTTKTQLNLEKEVLKQQMLNMDVTLLPYQITLVNARTAVITEKLKILPYLQELVALESELIGYIAITLGYEQSLADAKKKLVDARLTLIPLLEDLASKKKELAAATNTETDKLISIVKVEGQIVELEKSRTDATVSVANAYDKIEVIHNQIAQIRATINNLREQNTIDTMYLRNATDTTNANVTKSTADLVRQNRYKSRMIVADSRVLDNESMDTEQEQLHYIATQRRIDLQKYKDDLNATYIIETTKAEIEAKMMAKFIQYVVE